MPYLCHALQPGREGAAPFAENSADPQVPGASHSSSTEGSGSALRQVVPAWPCPAEGKTDSQPLARGPRACGCQFGIEPGSSSPKAAALCNNDRCHLFEIRGWRSSTHRGWVACGWGGGELPSAGEADVDQEGEAGRGARAPGAMLQQLLLHGGPGPWAGDRSRVVPPRAWHPSALSMLTPGPALGCAHQRQCFSPPSSFFLRHSALGRGAALALWEKLVFVGKLQHYDSEDTQGAPSWCQGAARLMS